MVPERIVEVQRRLSGRTNPHNPGVCADHTQFARDAVARPFEEQGFRAGLRQPEPGPSSQGPLHRIPGGCDRRRRLETKILETPWVAGLYTPLQGKPPQGSRETLTQASQVDLTFLALRVQFYPGGDIARSRSDTLP